MKIFNLGIQAALIVCFLASCQTPTENIDNQSNGNSDQYSQDDNTGNQSDMAEPSADGSQQAVDQSASSSQESNNADRMEQTQNSDRKRSDNGNRVNDELGVSGSKIIASTANKLNDRLKLSEEQYKSVTDILTRTYLASGAELNKNYSIAESKTIGKDLRKNSYEDILNVLDDSQKGRFEKLIKK